MIETRIPLENADIRLINGFLSPQESDLLFNELLNRTPWHQPEIKLFGKTVNSPRLAAWYGDSESVYQYSGLTNYPLPWTDPLKDVRQKVSDFGETGFNSVLLNYYRDGNDSMGWHSDDEPELGQNPVIASLSLGSERVFLLRQKNKKKQRSFRVPLGSGDLLMMGGQTQHHWKHSISRTAKPVGERINLTFRKVYTSEKT